MAKKCLHVNNAKYIAITGIYGVIRTYSLDDGFG